MRLSVQIALLLCLGAVVAAGGFLIFRHRDAAVVQHLEPQVGASATGTAAAAESKPQYWYDPMRPAEHFDKPGKSPFMDMQLVPKYSKNAAPGSIAVDSRVVQNLGLRLAKVDQGSFARVVDTVGSVAVDEHRIEAIQVRAPGWVERLDVRAVGDAVRRGRLLAHLAETCAAVIVVLVVAIERWLGLKRR